MRKAISPMVATVLLIAFTIGVGALVSIFATRLIITSTGITSNASESQTRCSGSITIDKVTAEIIIYYNPSPVTITGITGFTSDGTSINITGTGSASLVPGQTSSIRNSTGGISITNETINFAQNNTYYAFANSPVTAVNSVRNNTLLVTSGNYTSNSTHIALIIVDTCDLCADGNVSTGNYNVSYTYTGSVRTFNAGTNTSVILRGLCQSTITVEGRCKEGEKCWQV